MALIFMLGGGMDLAARSGGGFYAALENGRSLKSLLRIEKDEYAFRLLSCADSGGLIVRAGLEYGGGRHGTEGGILLAGPGVWAGSLRMLSAPTSYSAGLSGFSFPAEADPSLGCATSMLGLALPFCAGGSPAAKARLCILGIASGLEPGFVWSARGLGVSGTFTADAAAYSVPKRLPDNLAGGLGLQSEHLALMAALAARGAGSVQSGWRLDSPARPADSALFLALVSDWGGSGESGRAGAVFQCSAHGRPSYAFRLEGESRAGAVSAALRAGAAGPGFRLPLGQYPDYAAGLAVDINFALRHAASARIALRCDLPFGELAQDGTLKQPTERALKKALKIGLSLPLAPAADGARALALKPELEFAERAACRDSGDGEFCAADSDAGIRQLVLSLGLSGRQGKTGGAVLNYSFRALAELSIAEQSADMEQGGLNLNLESEARFGPPDGLAPSFDLSLKIILPDMIDSRKGPDSPLWMPRIRGKLSFEWQLDAQSSILIGLETEENDLGLVTADKGKEGAASFGETALNPEISLVYRMEFN